MYWFDSAAKLDSDRNVTRVQTNGRQSPTTIHPLVEKASESEKLESRLKEDDRQAFLERQRLKELERLKKQKAEQALIAEQIRKTAEEERRDRRIKLGLPADVRPVSLPLIVFFVVATMSS